MSYKNLSASHQELLLRLVSLNGRLAHLANELREVAACTDEMLAEGRPYSAFVNARSAMELAETAAKREQLANTLRVMSSEIPESIINDALKMDVAGFCAAHS